MKNRQSMIILQSKRGEFLGLRKALEEILVLEVLMKRKDESI